MKKIILAIGLIFALNAKAQTVQSYTPIATHDFGLDSASGLDKQIRVYGLNINVVYNQIIVYYEIVLISPNGVAYRIDDGDYVVDNSTANLNFTTYRNSGLGTAISYDISNDLLNIKSFNTYKNDIKQK